MPEKHRTELTHASSKTILDQPRAAKPPSTGEHPRCSEPLSRPQMSRNEDSPAFLLVCLTYKFKFQQFTSHMLYTFHLHLLVSLLSSFLIAYPIIIKRE